MLFPLGQVVATPGALELLERLQIPPAALLSRHQSGDWGDLGKSDRNANAAALHNGSRIFSAYRIAPEETLWILTEADRASTCLLLPNEY